MAYTPGPWKTDGNLIESPASDPIARVVGSRSSLEHRANAQLLAAATELLAAALAEEEAEDFREHKCPAAEIHEQYVPDLCGYCSPFFENAKSLRRAAIAKATGAQEKEAK